MNANPLAQAIAAYKAGDHALAVILLKAILRDNPEDEQAWLWLAVAITGDDKKIFCLEQALRINPANQDAQHEIARLSGQLPSETTLLPTSEQLPQVVKKSQRRQPPKPARRQPMWLLIVLGSVACLALAALLGILLPDLLSTYLPDVAAQFWPPAISVPPAAQLLPSPTSTLLPTLTSTPQPEVSSTPTLPPTEQPTHTPTRTPLGGGGQIAFVSERSGDADIFLVNPDNGSQILSLVSQPGFDDHPLWSPDGTRLLFASEQETECFTLGKEGCREVFLLDLNDDNIARLTTTEDSRSIPEAWMPDGRIAINIGVVEKAIKAALNFYLYLGKGGSSPWVFMNEVPGWEWLIDLPGNHSPRWSPDGRQVLVASHNPVDNTSDLILAKADGSGPYSIFPRELGAGVLSHPAWSPDGKQIAFVFTRGVPPVTTQALYIMGADGGNLHLLTDDGLISHPSWSPDGMMVAFASNRQGNWEIYLISTDAIGLVRLTAAPADDYWPAWIANPFGAP